MSENWTNWRHWTRRKLLTVIHLFVPIWPLFFQSSTHPSSHQLPHSCIHPAIQLRLNPSTPPPETPKLIYPFQSLNPSIYPPTHPTPPSSTPSIHPSPPQSTHPSFHPITMGRQYTTILIICTTISTLSYNCQYGTTTWCTWLSKTSHWYCIHHTSFLVSCSMFSYRLDCSHVQIGIGCLQQMFNNSKETFNIEVEGGVTACD